MNRDVLIARNMAMAYAKKAAEEGGGGGGGTSNYNSLENKPLVNGVELRGDKTLTELGIPSQASVAALESGQVALTSAMAVKVDKIAGKGLSTEDYTTSEKEKLAGLENYDDTSVTGRLTALESGQNVLTSAVNAHLADFSNPHAVTKAQVGLGNVDNTPDTDKPISTATQTALDLKIPLSQKGSASGVAELDSAGKVPSSQLPSYVDDVLEYDDLASFPATGEAGKIYIAKDTNKTYRWSGTRYVEISESLALGETSTTAYRGDRGKTAYDDSQTNKTNIGTMANLTTTEKGSLVGAINELDEDIENLTAEDITYDNTTSGLSATDVQAGLDELADEKQDNLTFDETPTAGSSNPVKSGGVNTVVENQRALLRNTVGWTGKNLLPNNAVNGTLEGITYTVNSDGSITLNGTDTVNKNKILCWNISAPTSGTSQPITNTLNLSNGKYILSWKDANGNAVPRTALQLASAPLDANYYIESIKMYQTSSDSGEIVCTITENLLYFCRIHVSANASFDNITLYPMLRHANDPDDSYEPFHSTVETELSNHLEKIETLQATVDRFSGMEDVYGLEADFENKSFERLAAAVGKSAGADFDASPMYRLRNCNLADDGTVNAYYGDAAYVEDGSNGQVMTRFPTPVYYRVEPVKVSGTALLKARFYISPTPHDGFKLHPAFSHGSRVFYGSYSGSLYDASAGAYITDDAQVMDAAADKLCSIAGAKPCSGLTQSLNKENLEKLAQNRGENWHLQTIQVEMLITLMMAVEYGTFEFQSVLGKGISDYADDGSTNMAPVNGSTASLGNGSGMASGEDGKASVRWRGIEDPYAKIWQHVNGLNFWGDGTMQGGRPYVCPDFDFNESRHDGNYYPVAFLLPNGNGYIRYFGYDANFDWLLLPTQVGGDSAAPIGDYNWVTANLNGYRIARLGATWGRGLRCGQSAWYCSTGVGGRDRSLSGRPAFFGE